MSDGSLIGLVSLASSARRLRDLVAVAVMDVGCVSVFVLEVFVPMHV